MAIKTLESTECEFNIFSNGRQHSGIDRGYNLDNFRQAVESPRLREAIKLREAYGYLGHGARELTGSMSPAELGVAKLKNGTETVLRNLPGCVMTSLDIDNSGNVRHTQEFLDNDEGRAMLGLHKSKVGGFSVAATGTQGLPGRGTRISQIHGFDYVTKPNFSDNRGFVLDSADGEDVVTAVLDSLTAHGLTRDAAVQKITEWQDSSALGDILHQYKNACLELEAGESLRRSAFAEFARRSKIHIPGAVLDSILSARSVDDLDGFRIFLEQASRLDGSQHPLRSGGAAHYVPHHGSRDPEFGSIESAPELPMY